MIVGLLFISLFACVLWAVVVGEPSAAEKAKFESFEAARAVGGSLADVLGTPEERVPTVFVMGAQKGGSSSLYELLIRHPALCGAIYKEPNFFLTNLRGGHDMRWYLSLFVDPKCLKRPKKLFVDGSCMLHGLDAALASLNATYGANPARMQDLKFIALLREPVSRDYSWYKHRSRAHLNRGGTFASLKTLGECLGYGGGGPTTTTISAFSQCHMRGDYLRQLLTFTRYFRRNQVLVLNSKLLFSDSPRLMPIIAEFLGVKMSTLWAPPFPKIDHIDQHIKNPTCIQRAVPSLDCHTRDKLAAYYAPKNQALEAWLNQTRAAGLAPSMEPEFESFGGESAIVELPCVSDSRIKINQLISRGRRVGCLPI